MYEYMCWTTTIIKKNNYKEMQLQNNKNEKNGNISVGKNSSIPISSEP